MILVELQELKENTMAEFEKQDFSFLSEDIEDEKVEIEVVDDTPRKIGLMLHRCQRKLLMSLKLTI